MQQQQQQQQQHRKQQQQQHPQSSPRRPRRRASSPRCVLLARTPAERPLPATTHLTTPHALPCLLPAAHHTQHMAGVAAPHAGGRHQPSHV
jgi:hypothetical protein